MATARAPISLSLTRLIRLEPLSLNKARLGGGPIVPVAVSEVENGGGGYDDLMKKGEMAIVMMERRRKERRHHSGHAYMTFKATRVVALYYYGSMAAQR